MHNDQLHRNLFQRFRRQGDAEALGTLFDQLAPQLLRLARGLARNDAEADDLLQATFVKAIEAREQYDEHQPLAPWLSGIMGNQWRVLRRQSRRRVDGRRLRRSTARDASSAALDNEVRRRVSTALGQLPEKYATVIDAYLLHDRPPKEIASELGRAPGTVRMQISRGLDLLRHALPVGLAGAGGVTVVSAASLGSIRQHVLETAHRRLGLTGAGATGGLAAWWTLLASRKLALGAAALLVGLASWWAVALTQTATPDPARAEVARSEHGVAPSAPQAPLMRVAVTTPATAGEVPMQSPGIPGRAAPPVGTVETTVVDRSTGRALPGAEVRFVDLDKVGRAPERDATLRRGDPDDFFRDRGHVYRADHVGRLLLPEAKHAAVWAVHGELQEELRRETAAHIPVRIELQPVRSLHVQILDAEGSPAAEVPVIARIDGAMVRSSWTDARGHARLPRIGRALGTSTECQIVANVPLRRPCQQTVAVSGDAWPSKPAVLRLPPTGSLKIEVRGVEGLVFPGELRYRLFNLTRRSAVRPSAAYSTTRPFVVRHVGLGLKLGIEVRGPVKGRAEIQSPTEAGTTSAAAVVLGGGFCLLTGRLLDAEGRPLSLCQFEATRWESGRSGGTGATRVLWTDADGRFVAPCPPAREGVTRWTCEFRVRSPGGATLSYLHSQDVAPLPGKVPLGDLRLAALNRIAAGRVVDEQGAPLAGVLVRPHAYTSDGRLVESIQTRERFEPRYLTDAQGRFEIRGRLDREKVRIDTSLAGYLSRADLWVPNPSLDLLITMKRSGSLAGRVRVSKGVPTSWLRVVAIVQGGSGFHSFSVAPDEAGRFEFATLKPGPYRVEIHAPGLESSLAAQETQVDPERAADPLVIDLTGRVFATTVSVLAATGERLQAIVDASPNRVDPDQLRDGKDWSPYVSNEPDEVWHARSASCVIYHRQRTVDLEVRSEGFEPEIRNGVFGVQEFRLKPVRK